MESNISTLLDAVDRDETRKITKLVSDYVRLGQDQVALQVGEWDAAHDLVMCYAPLKKEDYDKLDKGHPRRFVFPMTASQVSTMVSFIAQMLYGSESPWKVEGRGPDDEDSAERMNNLLRWNAEQQPTFFLGHSWIEDSLTYNRGIFYNSWQAIEKPQLEVVQVPQEDGSLVSSWKRVNKVIGGYCKAHLVSPYDWVCDPQLPLWRFQDGRFAGHKFRSPWVELERRSRLDPSHPSYILPGALAALKKKNSQGTQNVDTSVSSASPTRPAQPELVSRTEYERNRAGGLVPSTKADEKDPGVMDCWELWVRLVPVDYGLSESTEPTVYQFIVCSDIVLAANESSYLHGEFPYSVAEARPSAHTQNAPSWVMALKGIQDYVDWLKNRHQEALSRTVGNIFVADPTKIDVEDFLNPEKEGIVIPLKAAAAGSKIGDVFQQIPVKDLTENFGEEMVAFMGFSQNVTGVNSAVQGSLETDETSATQFASTQQMSTGRLATIARLLSVCGIVPQTRQFTSMFQQFLTIPQAVRYVPTGWPIRAPFRGVKSLVIDSDAIQGEFDFIPHDGTLPGADARRVAAISRLVESSSVFPQVFAPSPGNIDPRQIVFAGMKASGLNPELFAYTPESLTQAAGNMAAASGLPAAPGPAGPPGPTPAIPAPPAPPTVPPLPSAEPPEVRPA